MDVASIFSLTVDVLCELDGMGEKLATKLIQNIQKAKKTELSRFIYGFFIGVLTVIIRVANPAYPEGVMLAILLMNVFAPTIDHYVVQGNISKRKKRWVAALKTA